MNSGDLNINQFNYPAQNQYQQPFNANVMSSRETRMNALYSEFLNFDSYQPPPPVINTTQAPIKPKIRKIRTEDPWTVKKHQQILGNQKLTINQRIRKIKVLLTLRAKRKQ
eukprot:UN25138